ncbi:cysteine-rich DPF motif domain-containing protein 1 [Scaptodrosophila lebanonensis]|uniref:Cysteine-rich DPF motif domain-containing protein 1 n=1 Tax=Drosophila lebanonensis TaxID=7225 RepID=A0A6J2T264_DROLE|nr:cysteine-rich DPF motif domain-containing protein 1 [Scaptodrosophila lebanonensis]
MCSRQFDDDKELDLPQDNEEAEIARLQLPEQNQSLNAQEDVEADDERIARIEFHCKECDMHELVHYYGRNPPFALGVQFREDSYVMRDPFQAPPPRWQSKSENFLALGAKCTTCAKIVCKDAACSIYYTHTYCLPCARLELKSWPVEAQAKLRKQLVAKEAGSC